MKPIYPEIFTPDNTLQIIDNGNGTISIAEGQKFQIQDVVIDTTGRTDLTFPITAGKTYHLRYSLNGSPVNNFKPTPNSFYLVDVSDTSYNPDGIDESDPQFDTKYDDMLIAKIVVDANGVVTITPLKNKAKLIAEVTLNGKNGDFSFTLNFSRKPRGYVASFQDWDNNVKTDYTIIPDNPLTSTNGTVYGREPTRYTGYVRIAAWDASNNTSGYICASVRWEA